MQVILYRSLPVSYFSYCRMLKQYIVLFPASLPHRIFLDCISLFIRYDMITNYTLKGAYRFLRQPPKTCAFCHNATVYLLFIRCCASLYFL